MTRRRDGERPIVYVVVRRANGRHVRSYESPSRYAARTLRREISEKYDHTYRVTIETHGRREK